MNLFFPVPQPSENEFYCRILSITSGVAAKETLFLSIVGIYSLFPLLHPVNLLFVKLTLYLSYVLLQLVTFRSLFNIRFNVLERVYCLGFIPLFVYTELVHRHLPWAVDRLPFLPLLLTSVYCALGVFYFWLAVTCKFVAVRVPQGTTATGSYSSAMATSTKTTTTTTTVTIKSKSMEGKKVKKVPGETKQKEKMKNLDTNKKAPVVAALGKKKAKKS